MKKTLILTAALASAALTANAALFTDTWSTWTPEYQSVIDYNAGNGTLRSDASSNGGTSLGIQNGNIYPLESPGSPGYQGNAFTGTALYNSTALPTFTFTNTGTTWEGVTSLQLSIAYNSRSNTDAIATLSYGSVVSGINGVEKPGANDAQFNVLEMVYTWNFAEAVDLSDFQITYTAIGTRTGYESFTLTAVPEPSTYALLAGAFGLAAVVVARRRRA